MSEEQARVEPADAALLRAVADWWDPPYRPGWSACVNNEPRQVTGARLRALADVLEREEKERAEKTARCQECAQPVRPWLSTSRAATPTPEAHE